MIQISSKKEFISLEVLDFFIKISYQALKLRPPYWAKEVYVIEIQKHKEKRYGTNIY